MVDETAFDIDPELLAGFVDEAQEGLAAVDSLFVKLEAEPSNVEVISAIFRPVHTVKGNSAFFGLMKVKNLAHELETLLDLAKEGKLVPDQPIIDVLLEGVDQLKEMLKRTHDGQGEVEDETYFKGLLDRVIAAREIEDGSQSLWGELSDELEKAKTVFAGLDSSYTEQLESIISIANQLKAGESSSDEQGHTEQAKADSSVPEPLQGIKKI
ncbi:MAG: Hpt domain-containing protein, partial [Phycisphaerales bacterium]